MPPRRPPLSNVVACLLSLTAAAGCLFPQRVHVTTMEAPGATFSDQRSFRILPMPENKAMQPGAADVDDPMIENSMSGRTVRAGIAQEMTARGYVRHNDRADLAIAYYIGSRTSLVVSNYDYGYPFSDWKTSSASTAQVPPTQYEYRRGTVIVDVLDGSAKHVLWRGVGEMDLSVEPKSYTNVLSKAVSAVMSRFPGHAAVGA